MAKLYHIMPCDQSIDSMIHKIKDIQLFLMSIPVDDYSKTEVNLITYAIMKLKSMGLYTKVIRLWEEKVVADSLVKDWDVFGMHFISKQRLMIVVRLPLKDTKYRTVCTTIDNEDDNSLPTVTKGLTTVTQQQSEANITISILQEQTAYLMASNESLQQQLQVMTLQQ